MATTANANPVANQTLADGEVVVPNYDTELPARGPESADGSGTGRAALLRQHPRALQLQLWCAALVPFNILRHVRVLPSDAISCHFQTDGLAAVAPRLPYAGFFVFWIVGLLVLLLVLQALVDFLAKAEASDDDHDHHLSTLAVLYFGTPTMLTYMLINLAVIEANAEDSFVLPPSQGGPAMCPPDTCALCAIFVPMYYACVAGQRVGVTLLTWGAAVGLLVNLHPASSALGTPLFSLPQLAARLGALLGAKDPRRRTEHGLSLAIILLWLLWIGPLMLVNGTSPGNGWPYDGSCYRTDAGYIECSRANSDLPSPGGLCDGGEDGCSCDDKYACDGCHAEYPHDMGFVIEKIGENFACVPECVFAGGLVNYESYLCECSEGFQASVSLDGFGATQCAPIVQCDVGQQAQCAADATCAVLDSGRVACVCNRKFWGDGHTCARWTECELCRDLRPGQAPAQGRVCQYMTQQPDTRTDRQCAAATVCGPLGELTPLLETRDRTCVGSG